MKRGIIQEFVSAKRRIFAILGRHLLLVSFFLVGVLLATPVLTYLYFAQDLQTKESVMNRNDTGITLLDKDGERFFSLFEAKRKTFVALGGIPPYLKEAVIAAEDRNFYEHGGFSLRSTIAASIANLKKGGVAYGGSTITQQLVKNALLKPNKSFLRKYQELILAVELERRFSKDEILEMYLNSAYFGRGYFGIEEASQGYFGKSAGELTLGQASLLAGLLPSPTKLSSSTNGDQLKERQQFVLTQMVDEGFITEEEKKRAEEENISLKAERESVNTLAPHFAIMVRNELIAKYGEETVSRSGFTVKTTLDRKLQAFAEKTVVQNVERLRRNGASNGAAVVLDSKTSEIRALVGSIAWQNDTFGKVNVALSPRQPGSSFKPIVYVSAFEKGLITPSTVLHDQPTTYRSRGSPDYNPQNYDKQFRGNLLPRRALANSLNVPAVEVMSKTGVPLVVDQAKKFGITTLNDPSSYGLSLVLGAGEVKLLELTNVYAMFANKGVRHNPTTILEIVDKRGDTIYRHDPKDSEEKVLDEQYTYLISSILSDNAARSEVFGSALTISRPAAVKTGTTQNYKDAWTLGYTPSIAIGVWIGNNDGKPMDGVAGSLGPAPIWRALMEQFLKGTAVEQFEKPGELIAVRVCPNGGVLKDGEATTSAHVEYFVKGTEPTKRCEFPTPTPTTTDASQPTPQGPTPTPQPEQKEDKDKDKDKEDD